MSATAAGAAAGAAVRRPAPGEHAPWFTAPANRNPSFVFSNCAGHKLALVFLASLRSDGGAECCRELVRVAAGLRRMDCYVLVVAGDATADDVAAFQAPDAPIIFADAERSVHRLYGVTDPDPALPAGRMSAAFLLDEGLRVVRVIDAGDLAAGPAAVARAAHESWVTAAGIVRQNLPAPVLIVPNVVERELREELIEIWRRDNSESGYMRAREDGRLVGYIDHKLKRRRDHFLQVGSPPYLRLRELCERRVLPMVRRAFHYPITRVERYCIAAYDGADGGFFAAHRDFAGPGSHRAFAMTVNLNAEDYEGGELCFPEFGPGLYKMASGDAIIFSGYLLHEARPVRAGCRFALLSFFYGEREARVREAYYAQHGREHDTIDRNKEVA